LYNQISVKLPQLVNKAVAQVVRNLLKQQFLRIKDIDHWALHTGGDKIINSIKDEIGIEESKLRPTRNVLLKHGNMSSPTVWFVMQDILSNGVKNGDLCIMVAFGAGLSAHAFLFKKNG
jgi:predicted naringenin-chalcone synthase